MEETAKTIGRPTKLTELNVKKLEDAALGGLNITEMAQYVGVSRQTLYDWLDKNKELSDRLELLREDTTIKAKAVVRNAIAKGDIKTAQWHLERRAKKEYGPAMSDGATFVPIQIVIQGTDINELEE